MAVATVANSHLRILKDALRKGGSVLSGGRKEILEAAKGAFLMVKGTGAAENSEEVSKALAGAGEAVVSGIRD